MARRVFDFSVAAVATLAVTPLFLLFVVLIKISSPGPALFVQLRRGKDGRIFNIYKLRTLEARFDKVMDVESVEHDDSRIFPFGRFLRNRGLDEIPQFWNVLRGEMSIVGPRPHALSHDAKHLACIPGYARRYEVKPGITGWAQVNGSRGKLRSLEDAERRLLLDIYYIDNHSPFLDLCVLGRSFRILLFGAEASTEPTPYGGQLKLDGKSAADAPKLS